MPDKKPYRYLNALLAKEEFFENEFHEFLNNEAIVTKIDIDANHNFEGVLFVKDSREHRPNWAQFVDDIVGSKVNQLSNKSSSAVLFIRIAGHVLAFTFGYGRFLLNLGCFRQDFGLKTALNTLNHESLRSVDLHTLEDQPIQKRSQTARGSEASVFGIDIFRDVLRSVTGSPRAEVGYRSISGGDAIYSFGLEMFVPEIPRISTELISYYNLGLYKNSFGWVDNIRQVKDTDSIKFLDDLLIIAIKAKDTGIAITLPEIIQWDNVLGFSFTRSRRELSPTINADNYWDHLDFGAISIDSIKRDRLYITDVHDNEFNHPIYSCLYFEIDSGDTKKVIFGGKWYEIDKTFMHRIESILELVEISNIDFPEVRIWEEDEKSKIEKEGDYNERVSEELNCYLLDKKLVKCSKTTSPIELCDLLTTARQLVHVKHRKGGSAGLSHLFAQGSVSAEMLLGDRLFRKEARKVLAKISSRARDLVPLDGLKSADYEVVFLILGDSCERVKENLPFFSKVNLTRVYENLTQRGFKVRIGGADKIVDT